MSEEDDKKEKQTADMLFMQNSAKEFQDKMQVLQNKEYTGKVQGISIKMKGSMEIIDVHIDQSYYETAAKGAIEIAIKKCINNIENSIAFDVNEAREKLNQDIERIRVNSNGDY